MDTPVEVTSSLAPREGFTPHSLVERLLRGRRSLHTRAAYEKDLKDFFHTVANAEPTPQTVAEFLALESYQATDIVLQYKADMIERGLAEATVNRRLCAVKALVKLARQIGQCSFTLEDIKGEKIQQYRDTTGVSRDTYRAVLAKCDRHTLQGKRDYAILRLLWDNALRRGELTKANIRDFDAESKTLKIRGKGRGTQVEIIGLGNPTVSALLEWLRARKCLDQAKPLFSCLDRVNYGSRLTGEAVRRIVVRYCGEAGVGKRMSPHRVRHSAITAALDATDGNVRKVQKLSRHAKLDTLMIYDDNRQQHQLEISELLADMV